LRSSRAPIAPKAPFCGFAQSLRQKFERLRRTRSFFAGQRGRPGRIFLSEILIASSYYQKFWSIKDPHPISPKQSDRAVANLLNRLKLPPFPRPSQTKMHKVDASSDPSVSLVELSASNLRVCDSAVNGDAQRPSPQFGNRAMDGDQPRPASENNRKVFPGTGNATAASSQVPPWKRILDITLILLGMPLWLPVVILLTLWIKLASPGPIFFRQERVGYRGRRFMILKFRTMKVNVETQSHERYLEQLIHANRPMTKLDASGDPRIIPGGRILRAMGLDELPQLFNVFRGDMSLVGPRPCTPHEFSRYQAWQQERVNAAPGLTGYWQVNGKNKTTFTEMINMDIFYTKNMSLWLDLTIMFKTFPAVMTQVIETRVRTRANAGNGSNESVAGRC
jgi:lipopolysaccharide/colanic/teichoic acid biosynthesis glycosyltransferase